MDHVTPSLVGRVIAQPYPGATITAHWWGNIIGADGERAEILTIDIEHPSFPGEFITQGRDGVLLRDVGWLCPCMVVTVTDEEPIVCGGCSCSGALRRVEFAQPDRPLTSRAATK